MGHTAAAAPPQDNAQEDESDGSASDVGFNLPSRPAQLSGPGAARTAKDTVAALATHPANKDALHTVDDQSFWFFSDFFPLDTLNTALEGLTVLVDVAGHYPTPLVLVVVTRVTRKTPAEPPPAAACPCPLERFRPAGR